ncbi:MAG: cyclase family protein [Deltaproteobacteria bacterium]|nr:cyclase family protein [Deltaproteobacteria bacterium]
MKASARSPSPRDGLVVIPTLVTCLPAGRQVGCNGLSEPAAAFIGPTDVQAHGADLNRWIKKERNMETIGAGRWLSPEMTLKGLRLVKKGQIYRLGQVLSTDIPQLSDSPNISRSRRFTIGRSPASRPGSGALSEVVELPTHTGTHIDAFGHWYCDERVFGGRPKSEVWTEDGLVDLGIDRCPPLLTRGVLFDVAAHRGVEMLESDVSIDREDLEAVAGAESIRLQSGDVALVRTGWSRLWEKRERRYMLEEPGLTGEAARWLGEQGVVAIGADNWAIDACPPSAPRNRAVHELCLTEMGIYLIENLNLEELGRDRSYEFLFVAVPVRLKGGTGFPIDPVAVV